MKRLGGPLLALGALALTLLLAEGVARLAFAPPRYHNEPLELDPKLGFRGIPGYRERPADGEGALYSFVLNADGFRGRALPEPGGGEAERLLFLGDSFLVGRGVPEAELMTSRIETALRERGRDAEVYNLSAADYGTGQQLLLLERHGTRIAPDRVVLVMYPQNDVVNNYEGLAFRTTISPGDYVRPYVSVDGPRREVRYTHPTRAFLRRHLELFAQLERRGVAFAIRRGIAGAGVLPTLPEPPVDRLRRGMAPREPLELYRPQPPESAWVRGWQRTLQLVAAVRDASDALGARLLVVVIPDLHQVRRVAEDVRFDLMTRAQHGEPLDRYLDWNAPEERLRLFLSGEGIDTLLLLPALRRAAASGERVYLEDRHLNGRGHAIAAQALLAALAGEGTAAPVQGQPVRLPRGPAAPALVDLAGDRHWAFRDDAWIPWVSDAGDQRGALSLQRGLVAVPARGRELVVRGIAAARRYPLDVTLEIESGPRQSFRIEERGPFVLRARLPVARLPKSDGYLALLFSVEGDDPEVSTGVIVREVGFEPTR